MDARRVDGEGVRAVTGSPIRLSTIFAEETTPGDTGARVGAGADEVEIVDVFRFVMRTEPGALGEGRLDREGGAEIAVERTGKVTRVDAVFGYDVGLQVWQVVLFEVLHNCVAIGPGLQFPVDVGAEVGHGGEDVKGFAAVRGQRRVGQGRHVQIE